MPDSFTARYSCADESVCFMHKIEMTAAIPPPASGRPTSALTDVEGAARFLLTKWPDLADTTLHRVARQAALDTLMGATFVDIPCRLHRGCREAGILA